MDHTTRKLQKVGGGTFTISVPKDWATEQGLSAGTPVDIYPNRDGSLCIQSAGENADPLTEIRFEIPDENADTGHLADRLRTAYTTGYESITLATPSRFTATQRQHVRRAATRLPGLDVVDETETELTATDVLDHDSISIDQPLTRLQFVALSRLRAAVNDIHHAPATAGRQRDADVDRLTDQVVRYVNRSLTSPRARRQLERDPGTIVDLGRVAEALGGVAAHADAIHDLESDALSECGFDDELATLAATTIDVVDDATAAILGDPLQQQDRAKTALSDHDDATALVRRLDASLAAQSPPGGYALGRIVTILDDICDRGRTIALIALRTTHRETQELAVQSP